MTQKEFKETSMVLFASVVGGAWLIGKVFCGVKKFIKKLYNN